MVSWVVPQIMDAIDDDSVDVNRLCERINSGILHHPAQRNLGHDGVSQARNAMFDEVRSWWGDLQNEHNYFRRALSREGVMRGENHKEGVDDTGHGHGCTGKLKMRKLYGEPDTLENKIAGAAADAIFQGASGLISNVVEQQTGLKLPGDHDPPAQEKKSRLDGFLSKAGSILDEAFGKGDESRRGDSDSYAGSQTTYGHQESSSYGQSQQSSGYGGHSQHSSHRRDDDESHSGGYGGGRAEHRRRDDSEEGYGGRNESSYGGNSGYGRSDEGYGASGHHGRRHETEYGQEESTFGGGGGGYGSRQDSYGGRQESYGGNSSYGGHGDGDSGYGRQQSSHSSYGHNEESYGGNGSSYGGRDEDGHGRDEYEDDSYGRDRHGRRHQGGYGDDGGSSGY